MITDHDINSKKGLSSLHKINLEIKINKSILIFSIPESPSIPKIWSPLQCKNIGIPFYNIYGSSLLITSQLQRDSSVSKSHQQA